MSRYESSRFVRDPKVMNKEVLAQACDKLGWKYVFQGEDLLVTDLGGMTNSTGSTPSSSVKEWSPIIATTLRTARS